MIYFIREIEQSEPKLEKWRELKVNMETLGLWRKAFRKGKSEENSNVLEKVKSKEELDWAR